MREEDTKRVDKMAETHERCGMDSETPRCAPGRACTRSLNSRSVRVSVPRPGPRRAARACACCCCCALCRVWLRSPCKAAIYGSRCAEDAGKCVSEGSPVILIEAPSRRALP